MSTSNAETQPSPEPGTAAYHRWRRSQISAGLPTRTTPFKMPAAVRRYMRAYMRDYRHRQRQNGKQDEVTQ